jgi:hypothetical protein
MTLSLCFSRLYRPIVLASLLTVATSLPSLAQTLDQPITSVDQLNDVSPNDWAYQALQSLAQKHQCLAVSAPKYRGNQPLTRSEFAHQLQQCLDRIQTQLEFSDLATKADLDTLQQLQTNFQTELASLTGKVSNLEIQTQTLEKQQFSTTTKLFGQTIFGLQARNRNTADLNPRNGQPDTPDPATNLTFGHNTQLSLYTQFSPRTIALLGLSAGNLSTAANNDNLPYFLNDTYTRLAYSGNTNNSLQLSDATLRFLATDNLAISIGALGISPVTVFRGPNRYESAGSGPISSFAQRNPIINIGGQTGIGLDWKIADRLSLQAVYSAGNADNPSSGLFGDSNTIGVQLAAIPTNKIDWTLYYINQSQPSSRIGTGIGDDLIGFVGSRFRTQAIGSTVSLRLNPGLTLGGWVGYTYSGVKVTNFDGAVETFNWMSFVNLPDFGGRGNLAGIYFGQPPKITRSDLALNGNSTLNIPSTISGQPGLSGGQPGTTLHLEAFYRWQVHDNFSLTPGVIVLFNPVQTNSSDTIVIGSLRSTFTF